MSGTTLRKAAVGLGVTAAIAIPAIQQIANIGISQAEFSAQGDATLRAAGAAFSIWGLIYLALVIYAVRYARVAETAGLKALAWPAAIATAGCGAWIIASSANLMVTSVPIILVSAAAAVFGLLRASPLAGGTDRTLALWPVAMLAGWLTLASALNILTAATAVGLIAPASIWAIIGIGVVIAVAAAVALRARSWIYPLPIAWGLAWVYAAEQSVKPDVAVAAVAAAALMLGLAAFVFWRRR